MGPTGAPASSEPARPTAEQVVVTRSGPAAALQVGSLALGLLAPALGRRLSRGSLGRRGPAVAAAVLVASGNLVTAIAERRHPHRADWVRPRPDELGTDLTYFALQAPITGATASAVAAGIAAGITAATGRRPSVWPTRAPLAIRLGLALATSELSHYWWHRLGHGPGWRWHQVHHAPTRLYWLNATKFHAIDMVGGQLSIALPLLVLGADRDALLAYSVFSGTFGKVQHANVAGSSGVLGRALATPDLHRWHHAPTPGAGDRNFGARLIVWDRVFGTHLATDRPFEGDVGLGAAEPLPTTWAAQAMVPLR